MLKNYLHILKTSGDPVAKKWHALERISVYMLLIGVALFLIAWLNGLYRTNLFVSGCLGAVFIFFSYLFAANQKWNAALGMALLVFLSVFSSLLVQSDALNLVSLLTNGLAGILFTLGVIATAAKRT